MVLLRHLQRQRADDADRRHRPDPGARDRRVAEKTLIHELQCKQGQSRHRPGRGRIARLRCDGRDRRRDERRQRGPWGFGCGGVGVAAIAGALLAGATTIIAIDRDPAKLEWAKDLGATHIIDGSKVDDVIAAVQELIDGNGADVVIDAVGRSETYKQAFYARDLAGVVVLVGVPTPEMTLEMPLVDFFSRVRSSRRGTATACPSVISRCSSISTSRAVCRWTSRHRAHRHR